MTTSTMLLLSESTISCSKSLDCFVFEGTIRFPAQLLQSENILIALVGSGNGATDVCLTCFMIRCVGALTNQFLCPVNWCLESTRDNDFIVWNLRFVCSFALSAAEWNATAVLGTRLLTLSSCPAGQNCLCELEVLWSTISLLRPSSSETIREEHGNTLAIKTFADAAKTVFDVLVARFPARLSKDELERIRETVATLRNCALLRKESAQEIPSILPKCRDCLFQLSQLLTKYQKRQVRIGPAREFEEKVVDQVSKLATWFRSTFPECIAITTDTTDPSDIEAMIDWTEIVHVVTGCEVTAPIVRALQSELHSNLMQFEPSRPSSPQPMLRFTPDSPTPPRYSPRPPSPSAKLFSAALTIDDSDVIQPVQMYDRSCDLEVVGTNACSSHKRPLSVLNSPEADNFRPLKHRRSIIRASPVAGLPLHSSPELIDDKPALTISPDDDVVAVDDDVNVARPRSRLRRLAQVEADEAIEVSDMSQPTSPPRTIRRRRGGKMKGGLQKMQKMQTQKTKNKTQKKQTHTKTVLK
jgi:hypothetical protein